MDPSPAARTPPHVAIGDFSSLGTDRLIMQGRWSTTSAGKQAKVRGVKIAEGKMKQSDECNFHFGHFRGATNDGGGYTTDAPSRPTPSGDGAHGTSSRCARLVPGWTLSSTRRLACTAPNGTPRLHLILPRVRVLYFRLDCRCVCA